MRALDRQFGGDHYKLRPYQPVQLWQALDLNGFQAAIVKYVTRHRDKNGEGDLNKAEHFFELMTELKVNDAPWWAFWKRCETLPLGVVEEINVYCNVNGLIGDERNVILNAMRVGDGEKYLHWARQALNRIRVRNNYRVTLPEIEL